jgi:flagellin
VDSDYRAYSAIAKAAAINAKLEETGGARAMVQANLMSGSAMLAVSAPAPSGQVTVNGISIALTLTPNDTSTTRSAVVRAINTVTSDTGVIAKDTGQDATGIQLVASDGRNIEVQLDPSLDGLVGLKSGLQLGNIVMTTPGDNPLALTTTSGNIDNWGFNVGNFDASLSRTSTTSRVMDQAPVAPATFPSLQGGDLKINGFAIRATTVADDAVSLPSDTSDKASSAIALASAINASQPKTKVSATAVGPVLMGEPVSDSINLVGATSNFLLAINGSFIDIGINATDTPADRLQTVITAVNHATEYTGVKASLNAHNGVDLTTIDGRNLTITASPPVDLSLSDLGLNTGIPVNQFPARTYYGTVTLQSESPFKVEPGDNGYDTTSQFLALGFTEGNYGAESAGRLNFQVGARKYQTISIDMPDFGNNGPLTGLITADVNLSVPIVDIKSTANATKATSMLDTVLENVNEARATMGAVVNRLNHAMDNISNVVLNTSESRSKIEDTDYAAASSEVARRQIIQQAATAILAQANASQQTVMKLLQ